MNYTASYTADHGYEALLRTKEINRFTSPMFGGFDGVDITEADPFNNRELALAAGSATDKYEYASVKRALDAVSDAEVVECNMIAMPGITEETLNTTMVRNAEARADSLAIIDLPDVYTPPHERTATTFKERVADSVQSVVDVFTNRGINSSYGCTYYPWVKIYDETSDAQLWVPPSIPAMGVMANTERRSALWFAPAGFNRGGLTEGSAGISVIGVTERLAAKDRDKLYEVNINPIASFPAEGIVIFGQKTLQITQSALDRINVRRLMIFVKKRVSRIANSLLFDQNVQATWDRFTGQVQPFLETVKQGFGLTDFKVILDSSTTTPDLIDRNILYAKIFLKPARSIEFIAVDFVITNTGAAFED
jgi:phage tail sheath protein FI